MLCPRCNKHTLEEREKDGVTIDICQECRGIWLDRGELDKLLNRAVAATAGAAPVPAPATPSHRRPDFEDSDYRHAPHDPRRRKKSWLNDFFD